MNYNIIEYASLIRIYSSDVLIGRREVESGDGRGRAWVWVWVWDGSQG